MIDRNAEAMTTTAQAPPSFARSESPAQAQPLGIEAGSRGENGATSRPMAAWLCDEIYEGRNYNRQAGDNARS